MRRPRTVGGSSGTLSGYRPGPIGPVTIQFDWTEWSTLREASTMSDTAKLGWIIVYVPDVAQALDFYGRAFDLATDFIDERASFGQLATGATALAFATEERARAEIGGPFRLGRRDDEPGNVEICLVFDEPVAAFDRAVAAGCG